MRTFATKQPTNESTKQKKNRDKGRSRSISALSTGMPLLQRKCACGGGCPRCKEELGIQTKLKISEPGDKYEQEADQIADEVMRMPEPSVSKLSQIQTKTTPKPSFTPVKTGLLQRKGESIQAAHQSIAARLQRQSVIDDPIHQPIIENFRREQGLPLSGVDEFGQQVGPSDAEIKYGLIGKQGGAPPGSSTPTNPCPTSVRVGSVAPFNHSNLSTTDKDQFGTYLGAVSRMDVGPGPNHSGHCMREQLRLQSNTCPAALTQATQPCSKSDCLPINRFGSAGDALTRTTLTDGPTAFIDLHRTRNRRSLLEGTGVSSCSIACEQIYSCNGTQATGSFQITRNFVAGTHTRADGTIMHITTGTVTKT
jgi:hypothetical protein